MEEIKIDTDTSLNYIYSLIKDLKKDIKTLKNEHNKEIEILKNEHNKEIKTLKNDFEGKIKKIETNNKQRIDKLETEIKEKNNKLQKLQNDVDELRNDLNNEIKEKNSEIKRIEGDLKKKIERIEGNFRNDEEYTSLSKLKRYIKERDKILNLYISKNIIMNLEEKFPEKEFFQKIKDKIIEFCKIYDTFLESKIYCTMGVLTKNKDYFDKGIEIYYDTFSKNYKHGLSYVLTYKGSIELLGGLLYEESIGKNGNKDEILEWDFKDYNKYTVSNWNFFFIRNALHQIISFCNEVSVDYVYSKIKNLSPEFNNYKGNSKIKEDASAYFEVLEKFELITFIKIFIDDINKENQK